jgi:hypothetical protein
MMIQKAAGLNGSTALRLQEQIARSWRSDGFSKAFTNLYLRRKQIVRVTNVMEDTADSPGTNAAR